MQVLWNSPQDYEVREYPRSKWICTKDTVDLDKDPFEDWQTKYDGDPFKVLASPEFKKCEVVRMFFTLFAYIQGTYKNYDICEKSMMSKIISGANDDGVKIPMTKPVTTRVKPDGDGREKMEACFWAGSRFEKDFFLGNRRR